MKSKMEVVKRVNFHKSGSGSVSGKIILPMEFLKDNGITKEDPEVIIKYVGNRIIIEKASK